MPHTKDEQNTSGINWMWIIVAIILMTCAFGAVFYYLSKDEFRVESINKPGAIPLEKSIEDTNEQTQWACFIPNGTMLNVYGDRRTNSRHSDCII